MKRILASIALAGALLAPVGCANQKPVQAPIPGATSSFDQNAYQTLRVAHDIAKSLSDQAKAGTYKPTPAEKATVNQFIADLNIADTIYSAYHNGAATQAQAQAAIDKVTAEQATLPVGGSK